MFLKLPFAVSLSVLYTYIYIHSKHVYIYIYTHLECLQKIGHGNIYIYYGIITDVWI